MFQENFHERDLSPLELLYRGYVLLTYDIQSLEKKKDQIEEQGKLDKARLVQEKTYKKLVSDAAEFLIAGNFNEETRLTLHKIILTTPYAAPDKWLEKFLDDVEDIIKAKTGQSIEVGID